MNKLSGWKDTIVAPATAPGIAAIGVIRVSGPDAINLVTKHGEFTQRAFINGKLDLTQAESVADLIVANTKSAQRFAIHNLRGGFSVQLKQMREQLIQFASLIELELDFATEDVEFADRARFHTLINDIEKVITELIASFQLGNVVKNGVSVAIIGKPNAGKSTLLNALLKEERAIVSEIAGTTRDTIEETLNIDGVLHRIIDTAGIRENSVDQIENKGIERSLEKMRTADLVIYLFDVNTETNLDLEHRKKKFEEDGIAYLLVANKCDGEEVDESENDDEIIRISAKHELGIEHLKRSMFEKTVGTPISNDQTVVTNARHLESLQNMSQSILQIKQGLLQHIPGDLLSIEIRSCLFHLGEITGEVTSEDKLDYIFSKFCIGK